MKKYINLFIIITFLSIVFPVFSAGTVINTIKNDEMKKLEPFVGKWKTLSVYQKTGLKAPGILEYRWILGKKWMFIEFIGKHPKKKYWGAYGFFRYDTKKKCYISYDIFDENEPTFTTGYWLNTKTLRFEDNKNEKVWGIDYTLTDKGNIYQENWVKNKENKRTVTLKTTYTRIR